MGKKIHIKTPEQIKKITTAGKFLTELLLLIRDKAQPGVALIELESIAAKFLKDRNLRGSFKGYQGFPANLCLSVNDCVVHGIPDDTELQPGDLLKIDAGVTYKSCIADSAISCIIGGDQENPQGAALIQATKEALDGGVALLSPQKSCFEYASFVFSHMKKCGFAVIKNLTGHGVGTAVHEGPSIYNRPHPDMHRCMLQPGMVIALEPITALVSEKFVEDPFTGRNIYTEKGDLGAQREYTVAVTEKHIEIVAGVI